MIVYALLFKLAFMPEITEKVFPTYVACELYRLTLIRQDVYTVGQCQQDMEI